MRKTKNLAALVLATAAIFMSGFLTYAANKTSYNPDIWNYSYNDGVHGDYYTSSGYDKISDIMSENLYGNKFEAPGWVWLDGYCYYITAENGWDVVFKNGTTPDGYTVDEQGRWTVNGVPQRDDLGHQSFWTGRDMLTSDIERWDTIRKGLYQYWRTKSNIPKFYKCLNTYIAKSSQDDTILLDPDEYDRQNVYLHYRLNGVNYGGTSLQYAPQLIKEGERTYNAEMQLKAVLGDNEGQRFFDYWYSLKTAVPENCPFEYKDETGETQLTYIPCEVTHIDYSRFDPSLFTNRLTDYGKRYEVRFYPNENVDLAIVDILVYY